MIVHSDCPLHCSIPVTHVETWKDQAHTLHVEPLSARLSQNEWIHPIIRFFNCRRSTMFLTGTALPSSSWGWLEARTLIVNEVGCQCVVLTGSSILGTVTLVQCLTVVITCANNLASSVTAFGFSREVQHYADFLHVQFICFQHTSCSWIGDIALPAPSRPSKSCWVRSINDPKSLLQTQ